LTHKFNLQKGILDTHVRHENPGEDSGGLWSLMTKCSVIGSKMATRGRKQTAWTL
jgi:hypothetical protein